MKKVFIITVSFAAIMLTASVSNAQTHQHNSTVSNATAAGNSKVQGLKQVPTNQVCMVNNKFMNKEQIKVPVDGKDYYGCCQGCVAGLKGSTASRLATDPLTGETVDKATAFIVLKPGSEDEVLYFNSEANAKKFLEQKN